MVSADAPLETVPMFVRSGSIIPMGPQMNYVGQKPFDPITFAIYPDDKGSALTTLYEDDGLSPAYKEGAFRRTTVAAKQVAGGYIATMSTPDGRYNPGPRKLSFVINPTRKVVTIVDDGRARSIAIK